MIYLDYNASVPLRPQAREAMLAVLDMEGNPSSPHGYGRRLRAVIDQARKTLEEATQARRVIFTSGCTEANAFVCSHFSKEPVLLAAFEHPSVLKNVQQPHFLPVTSSGVIDTMALERELDDFCTPGLLSLMLVNNETGVIQPVQEVAQMARSRGWKVHVDATQAMGHAPLSLQGLGVDFMTLSSHKCGGPIGIGALAMRQEFPLKPLIAGGGQEYGLRSGTLSAPLAAGFEAAFVATVTENPGLVASWQRKIEQALPQAIIYGKDAPRVPTTLCLGMPGVPLEVQLMAFDLQGIAVGAGAACSSGTMKPSTVLVSMGVSTEEARCALRVSMGWKTTLADVEAFIDGWLNIYEQQTRQKVS